MSQTSASSEWFVQDAEGVRGPFSEAELRDLVTSSTDPELQVRQNAGAWHPASVVRKKIEQLAANGIFIRYQKVVEGPFTISRARKLLRSVSQEGISVRSGEHGNWVPAGKWLDAIAKLEQKQNQKTASAAKARSRTAARPLERPDDQSPPKPAASVSAGEHNATILEAVEVEEEEIIDAVMVDRDPLPEAVVIESFPPGTSWQSAPPVPSAAGRSARGDAAFPSIRVAPPPGRRPVAASPRSRGSAGWILAVVGVVALLGLLVVGVVGWALFQAGRRAMREIERQERGMGAFAEGTLPQRNGFADQRSASASPAVSTPPTVTPGFLFRPQFVTRSGTVDAGTAFAAQIAGQQSTYIVSALHLFGPAGGLAMDLPAATLGARWTGLSLVDCRSSDMYANIAMRPVLLPLARPLPHPSTHGDVAVCELTEADRLGLRPLPLATERPNPGDRVWLVSEVIGRDDLVHAATIDSFEEGWLIYRFDRSIELRATSGAPVVDGRGRVVAVNAGGGEQAGRTFGVGTPTTNFASALKAGR